MTERIAELIRGGTPPERILAVTFTNKAAGEMRERMQKLICADLALSPYDIPKTEPFIGTFHALGLHMIRSFHRDLDLPRHFTIYDRDDSSRAARDAIVAAGFDPKELEPRRVISAMSRAKGDALDVEVFRSERTTSYTHEAIAEVWEQYEKILKKDKALDFDDILVLGYQLLRDNTAARTHFQSAWDYLHVDEYQDTNRIQYEIMRILAERHRNIAVVGDADQNIYSWRGASIEHILNFERDFPGGEVIELGENYRSTKTILTAAGGAIEKNVKRRDKKLFTNNEDGELIAVREFADELGEAAFVAEEARNIARAGTPLEEIAVLYRANFQSRVLEEAFLKSGIPYQVLGTRFFERKEVRDALAHLRVALNPGSVTDFARAIQSRPRGIGKTTLAKIFAGQEESLSATLRDKVRMFRADIAKIKYAVEGEKVSDAVRVLLAASGLAKLYEHGHSEDSERLENLKELVTVASKYDVLPAPEGIEKFLEEAALQSDQDELTTPKEGVKLMTVHAAKGLEFDVVFVTGLEDGLFPHERDESEHTDNEEERRLFYVALTRAKKKAYLTYAATRRIFGTRVGNLPSEFVSELDPALVEVVSSIEI
jgi:DNA helicase-2/ATP-dependent DNA helicase PcrA